MADQDEFDDGPATIPDGYNIPADEAIEELSLADLIDGNVPQNEFADDVPTAIVLYEVCPGCGGGQHRIDDAAPPPTSHEEAWRAGPLRADGTREWEEGACRGNKYWFWCRVPREHARRACLTIVQVPDREGGQVEVLFYEDRRLTARPVPFERRGRKT